MTSRNPPDPSLSRRWEWAMLPLLLLAFGLRVYRIGEQRVWWDEGWSVWLSRFGLLDILRETGNDVHPPLYFWLLHLWGQMVGESEAGLRLLSAFLGTLTVAATYLLGREIGRRAPGASPAHAVGLLAALLLAVSRFAIAWSQEIRMYALAALLAVVALWAARRYWDSGGRGYAAAYVLSMTAGLYTLYMFAPVLIAANVAFLWVWREAADRRAALWRWLGMQALVLLLFLPWAWYAAGGFLSTSSATPITPFNFLHIYWTVLTVGIPLDVAQFNRLTLPALLIFGAAVAAVTAAAWRGLRSATGRDTGPARDLTLLLTALALPLVLVYLGTLPREGVYAPPFSPRYLVIFASLYSILLAWGIVLIGRRLRDSGRVAGWWRPALAVGMAAVMLAIALSGLRPYHPGRVLVDDYKSLVDTLEAYRQPGDAVVLYTDTDWPIFAFHYPEPWVGVPHLWTITPETAAGFIEPLWRENDGLWLVTTPYSAGGDPQRHLPAWLAAEAEAAAGFDYNEFGLTFFARSPERAAGMAALADGATPPVVVDVPLGPSTTLAGYGQAARDFKSGDTIHLFLYHQGDQMADLTVNLVDASGRLWPGPAATLPAAAALSRQQVNLVVPPEAPDGAYQFVVSTGDGTTEPFGRLTIRQKQDPFVTAADVAITTLVDAPFEQGVRLLGYDLVDSDVRPGEVAGLTLYWQSDGGIEERYKVFTHLLGDVFNAGTGNFLWGQVDNEPGAGSRPTTSWRAGEVIVDTYAIPVQPDAPPGTYQIEIGLYEPVSGQRLAVLGESGAPAADHIILTTIQVAP